MVQKGRKVYVLEKDGVLIGVWSNLKHLCNDMKDAGPFLSYSTLSKESKESGKLEFEKDGYRFVIHIEPVK